MLFSKTFNFCSAQKENLNFSEKFKERKRKLEREFEDIESLSKLKAFVDNHQFTTETFIASHENNVLVF